MSTVAFTSGTDEQNYIEQAATQLGLDPKAVLAVAAHEGVTLPAEVGDNDTSFGPWQLHIGGALPSSIASQGASYAQTWANSPAGLMYALEGIKKAVGSNTQGLQEIYNQVYYFEKPTDKAGETARADETYAQGGGPALDGAVAGGLSTTGTQQGSSLSANAGPQTGTAQPVSLTSGAGSLISGIFGGAESDLIRFGEFLLGVGLIGLGLVGIYLALFKGKSDVTAIVAPLPVVGQTARQNRADTRTGRRQAERAQTKTAARRGSTPQTGRQRDDAAAQAAADRSNERNERIRSRAAADSGTIPF